MFRMGSEGQQDIEMAILTALLKGELLGTGDRRASRAGLGWGSARAPTVPGGARTLGQPGCLESSQHKATVE